MSDALITIAVLLATGLLGYAVLALADVRKVLDEAERMTLAFPVGIATLGASLYTLNVMGLRFGLPLVLSVLILGSGAGLAVGIGRRQQIRALMRPWRSDLSSVGAPEAVACIVVLLVFLGLQVVAFLNVNCQPDTELYHFPYAAIVWRTGHQPQFATMSSGEQFSFPPALFVSYAAEWACLGHIDQLTPNLLSGLLLLAWAALTVVAMRRLYGMGGTGVLLSLLLLAGCWELQYIGAGENTDLLPMILGAWAAYLVARDLDQGVSCRTGLAAFVLGLSAWVKYQGLAFAVCLAAAALMLQWRSTGRLSQSWRGPALLILGTVGWIAPFLLRNTVAWGNPVYPSLCGWLGGYLATPWTIRAVAGWWQPPYPFYDFHNVLLRILREPPVLFGIPTLFVGLRGHSYGKALPGLAAAIFLVAFMAVLSNPTPEPLRFLGVSTGLLSWLGAVGLQRLGQPGRRAPSGLLGWMALCGLALGARDLWLLRSHPNTKLLAWMFNSGPARDFAALWYILPLAGLILALNAGPIRACKPALAKSAAVLALAGIALVIQAPLNSPLRLARLGLLSAPDWRQAPDRGPAFRWMWDHLSPTDVLYGPYHQRWALPCPVVPDDDPLLSRIHQPNITLRQALDAVRLMGVTHVLAASPGTGLPTSKVDQGDIILAHLSDPRWFEPLESRMGFSVYRIHFPRGGLPAKPTSARPMPWLLDYAASGPRTASRHPHSS